VSNSQKNDSVFDFLYVDRARIALYASQLLDDGSSQTMKRLRSSSTAGGGKAGGNLGIGKLDVDYQESASESIEHTSDLYWNAVIGVLAELQDKGFICANLPEARFGTIVQFNALIQITDLRFMRSIWDPIMKLHMNNSGIKMNRAKEQEIASIAKILEAFPHSLQLHCAELSGGFEFWGTLRPENFVGSSDDLPLMHGAGIKSPWVVIGILDAFAEGEEGELFTYPIRSEVLAGLQESLKQLRLSFGRPLTSNGITPICIFRQIEKETGKEIQPTT
jgi:hypothetical protein